MSESKGCGTLSADLRVKGTLYLAPPLPSTLGTLRRLLWESDLPFGDPFDGVVAAEVCPVGLGRLCEVFVGGLSVAELKDCRAILVEEGSVFGLHMLPRMRDLFSLACGARGGWLRDMLTEDRLTAHFQPIVLVSNPSEVFAYESLLRGVGGDGGLTAPGPMFEVARPAGLLPDLDRSARLKAIEQASLQGVESRLFVNFDRSCLHDPWPSLRSTVEAVQGSDLPPENIVFEVTESDEVGDTGQLRRVLGLYREAGFGVALDDLGSNSGSLDLLASVRPDFVKLDMRLAHGLDRDPYRATIARKLIELAGELGVRVIAKRVETEEQWRWLAARGADYAQGHFFAEPGSPPPVPARDLAEPVDTHQKPDRLPAVYSLKVPKRGEV